jgi:hypothetical protein
MTKAFYKHKLLLDENMAYRTQYPSLNERFDIKHVVGDYKRGGLPDADVYALARQEGRLLITYNIKDFIRFAPKNSDTGIIGVSPNLPLEQIDKKLTALLIKATENELRGKFTYIGGEM